MGAPGERGCDVGANPPPGSGCIPTPGGGAMAEAVGDRGALLEPRSGVGKITPQDAEAPLPSPQGLTPLLPTAFGEVPSMPVSPMPHTTAGAGAVALLQSTCTFPELEGI